MSLLVRVLGAEYLRDPWNPYIVVLPLALMVFLTWSLGCGDRWALPVAVVVATFVVQTHIGYAALAVPLMLWGTGWLVVPALRRRELRRLTRPLLAAGVAGAILWLPVAIEQVVESPGNLSLIRDHFDDPPGDRHRLEEGARVVLGQFEPRPEWLTGARPSQPFTGEPEVLRSLAFPVLLVPFGAAALLLWRRRAPAFRQLLGVLALLALVGAVSVAQTTGPAFTYRLGWAWVVGALAGVIVLRAAWMLVSSRVTDAGRRPLLVATVDAVVLLGAVNGVAAARAGVPEGSRSEVVSSLVSGLVPHLSRRNGVVVLAGTNFTVSATCPRSSVNSNSEASPFGCAMKPLGSPQPSWRTRPHGSPDRRRTGGGHVGQAARHAPRGLLGRGQVQPAGDGGRASLARAARVLLDPTSPESVAGRRLSAAVAVFADVG